MRIEAKAAVALIWTNFRGALLAGLSVIALTSCGGGDDSSSCPFSAPPPRINSYPPTVATAGYHYGYGVGAAYTCWFIPLFVTMTCGDIVWVQLPAGASTGWTGFSWTPQSNQANTDVPFVIATEPDICGRQARQSWTVHVYAPPVIESFTAERAFIHPGESTVLTAVFQGGGQIEGLGPLTSGVSVATPVLSTPTTFTLIVTNSAGAQVRQTLTVEMPPTVISTNPVNEATEVPVNGVLFVRFSKEMDSATITPSTFLLKDGSNKLVSGTVTVTAAGDVATFAPARFLGYLTPYTAIITNGVRDARGNSMVADYEWGFVSDANPDTTPPRVISTSPANETDGVATENIELLVTFSESIDPNSVNSSTFILMDSSQNPVNGTIRVTSGGNTAAFLAPILANSMSYTAIVTTGIMDLAGNPVAASYSWTFTTEAPGLGTWQATSTHHAPSERIWHTAVWTGSEMIVWGGWANYGGLQNTGARYNPVTDVWAPISNIGAPSERRYHTAIWTGSEMIVWGGEGISFSVLNSGARYNPVTDVWTPISNIGAPSARYWHMAVWTGSEMIVWGGYNRVSVTNSGARYNPVTDVWVPTSTTGAPFASMHTAVWTGSEMIVWGGYNRVSVTNSGARYNPVTDIWVPTSNIGAPSARYWDMAVWTGSEMIVWGGYGLPSNSLDSGGRYNPATDVWVPTSNTSVPSVRYYHTAVWTGREMIVWGGQDYSYFSNSGARYNPVTDLWAPTSNTGVPSARAQHTAVWTGSKMIVWGGYGSSSGYPNTGGRYGPQEGSQ